MKKLECGSKSSVNCKHGMNSVTKGNRPGPKVISLHLTLNIGLPQVCLFNRFVPYWCILFFVQSFIPAHREEIYPDQTGNMHSLNPSVLHIHQSFSFSCSQFTSKMTFRTRERRKDHYSLQHKGQIFHCFPLCQGKTVVFTVAQQEHRAAQVLCAPSLSELKVQQEMRSGVWPIICNLNKCHQLGYITYVCPLNAKNSVSTQELS